MTEHEDKDKENNQKNTSDVKSEIDKLKEDMAKMKEMLKSKAEEETEEEVNIGGRSRRKHKSGHGFRIEIDDEDFGFEGVDETLGNYLSSVMEGVAQNISQSMKQMTTGFQFDNIAREMERAKRDIKREKRHVKREVKQAKREAKRAAKEAKRAMRGEVGTKVMRFQSLSAEELDRFYELAPDLTSALSDEKKLRLLKGLEDGPMYQKDLSEETEIKGGTFKHHMDSLLEVQYVAQEAVRGRYLITQLGVEALKLSEMLFRRFVFITEEDAKEREEDFEEDLDSEVEKDITTDADAVENMKQEGQNEEAEG